MNLSEAWDLYSADKKLDGFSNYTLNGYGIQARLLIRALGNVLIEEITTIQLKNYLINQTHLKPSSLGHRIRFIKSLFRWAQDEGIINGNAAAKLHEPKEGKRLPKYLTQEEIELLRLGCNTSREHSLFEFLYSTGCRIGEVYSLKLSDINIEDRTAIVIGKGNKQREVYFSLLCKIWLEKYLTTRKDNKSVNYLFISERKPYRRLSIAQLRTIIKTIAKNSSLDINVYPHRYRHTFCTHLLENNAPMELISSLAGHAKVSTTKIYAELSGTRRKQEYNKYFR